MAHPDIVFTLKDKTDGKQLDEVRIDGLRLHAAGCGHPSPEYC